MRGWLLASLTLGIVSGISARISLSLMDPCVSPGIAFLRRPR
jgi:hypothetical protein